MIKGLKSRFKIKLSEILFVFLVVLSSAILGFSGGGFVVDLQEMGFAALSVLQKGVATVASSITGAVEYVRNLSDLQERYNNLSDQLEEYEMMQRFNADIRKENERLKEQLGFSTTFEYKSVAAQIIGRDMDNLYSTLTLNKGSKNGVKKGAVVLAVQNGTAGIVGRVITVGPETSIVMPLYDYKCNISARIQNSRDIGLVTGNGSPDGPLSLNYIRKSLAGTLSRGDLVVTSGENSVYIKDIPIGRISKITEVDYDSSLQIELESILDFQRLESIFVVDQSVQNERHTEIE